jgi:hypothetical protein
MTEEEVDKLSCLQIHMVSGKTLKGYYSEDEYEEIYDSWHEGGAFLYFRNCQIKVSQVEAIEWGL